MGETSSQIGQPLRFGALRPESGGNPISSHRRPPMEGQERKKEPLLFGAGGWHRLSGNRYFETAEHLNVKKGRF